MEKNKKKEPELKASDKQTVEAFAKKKKRFIIEKLRDLSVNHEIANKYLAEAIAYSTSLRTLIIEGAYLTSKHWKVICEGIVKNKNSIESLIFSDYIILEDDALEVVDQIFRWKKIRFVHLMNFSSVKSRVIEKFVDSMNNCNTLERVTMSRLASYHSVHYFFGCLRNKLVKKFKLTDSALTDDQIGALARFINNSNVTNLHLGVRMSVVDLTPIISASNCVKKLTLNNNVGTTQEVELLINAMKTNTRISTLKIIHDRGLPTDPIHFAEQMQKLLKDTKTIQSISLIDRSMTQYVIDGIFSNTSLTALDLTVMSAELYEELCEALLNHPKIEKMKIRSIQPIDYRTTLNLIRNSKTIVDFDISDSENLDDDILKRICQIVSERAIYRRIKMTLDTVSLANNELFWQTITNTTSLNCVEIDYSCSKPFNAAIWNKIERVLDINKGIISVGKMNDIPDNVKQQLDRNKKIILYNVGYTKMFVNMIARRSDSFTEKLPLEIWLMVLKHIYYHGTNIKFDQLLSDQIY